MKKQVQFSIEEKELEELKRMSEETGLSISQLIVIDRKGFVIQKKNSVAK